jgi:hypothetical protein
VRRLSESVCLKEECRRECGWILVEEKCGKKVRDFDRFLRKDGVFPHFFSTLFFKHKSDLKNYSIQHIQ